VLRDSDYPGALLPPASLGGDVLWQQRVTASWGDGDSRGFDAAVQKRGDQLTVIGLSPLGQPGFVMQLQDGAMALQNHTDMAVPFPPRFVVLDVQRVFFPWLPAAPELEHGEREGIAHGERIAERFVAGRLVERRFTRLDGAPAGSITVRYDWRDSEPGRRAPRRAELEHGWFGYRLVIDTHTETALPSSPP
jgi:hypothetical protein